MSDTRPCATIEYGASRLESGDTLKIHAGTYVLSAKFTPPSDGTPRSRTVIMGFPGEAKPVIDARNLRYRPGEIKWTRVSRSNVWVTNWQARWTVPIQQSSVKERLGRNEEEYYREQITIGDDPLPLLYYNPCSPGFTGEPAAMPAGRICVADDDPYHGSPTKLYVHLRDSSDPNTKTIRMSTLQCHINCNDDNGHTAVRSYLHIKGLHLKYAAATNAMVVLGPGTGGGHIVEDCVIEYSNSDGITGGGSNNLIRNNILRWGGKGNITASKMHDSIIEYNQSGIRNWKGYRCSNSCGDKFIAGSGNSIRYNYFGSPGPFNPHAEGGHASGLNEMGNEYQADGIWMDAEFNNNQIYGNHIDSTWRSGIFNEISVRNIIFSNLITRVVSQAVSGESNRMAINVAGSQESLIAHNTIIDSDGCYHVRSYAREKVLYNIVKKNLFINNVCYGNDWQGVQINVSRRRGDKGMTDALLESNRADGNAYFSNKAYADFFHYKSSGTERAFALTSSGIAAWRAATGNDRSSIIASARSADEQILRRAIAIPDTSWWNPEAVRTDFVGKRRPSSGGTIGALEYSDLDMNDTWYLLVAAENKKKADYAAAAWSNGAMSHFSSMEFSRTGARPATYYGAFTTLRNFVLPQVLSAERRGMVKIYKASEGWTLEKALADLGLSRIH